MDTYRVNTNALKGARMTLGKTQKRLAMDLGMPASTYGVKERGEILFSIPEMLDVVSVLNLDYDSFNTIFCQGKLPYHVVSYNKPYGGIINQNEG